MTRRVHMNDRAVRGVAKLDRHRLFTAFHAEQLPLDLDVLPGAAIAVAAGVFRIELLHVKVLLIDADRGESPGNALVVPQRDSRQRRLARADRVPSGSDQMY